MIKNEDAQLIHGDCLEVLKGMPDNSVDSIVTDPPYGLSFMGKKWDYDVPDQAIWEECLRVLKPGGHLLAFAGTRTQHRMAARIEDAGFEIRDMIAWVYGSGFPKSMDVSKAIDKARVEDIEPIRRVCRAVRTAMDAKGLKSKHLVQHFGGCHPRLIDHWAARDTDSQPSLPTWEQWETLRNVLGLDGTHDAEVLRLNGRKGQHGDTWRNAEVIGVHEGMRMGFGEYRFKAIDGTIRKASDTARQWQGWGTALKPALEPITVARKPFKGTVADNVLERGTGAINIDGCRVGTEGGTAKGSKPQGAGNGIYGAGLHGAREIKQLHAGRWPANLIHDGSDEPAELLGAAARFFYCAKASKKDRGDSNTHPTVKPTDLMAYLCRLVTPPGGVVLDPFMGSGSTGKAAMREGFRFIGIEMDAEYLAIAEARIAHEAGKQPEK